MDRKTNDQSRVDRESDKINGKAPVQKDIRDKSESSHTGSSSSLDKEYDEQESDGSGGAFEGTEAVKE